MPYLTSSAQCGDMVGEPQVLGSAFLRSASDLSGIAVEHVADGDRRDEAVVVAPAERRLEEEVAGLLEADQRLLLVRVALHVGMAGLPVERARAVGLEHRIGHEQAGRFHVGDEHGVGVPRGEIARQHHADLVGEDLVALVVDHAAAVAVAVEAEADVGLVGQHRLAHGVQHLHVFGIGVVAREGVVELAVERHHLAADALPAPAARRRPPCRCRRRPPP